MFVASNSVVLAGTDTVPLDNVIFTPHPVVGGQLFVYAPQSWMPTSARDNFSLRVGYRLMHSWQGDAIGKTRGFSENGIEKDIQRTDHVGSAELEYRF